MKYNKKQIDNFFRKKVKVRLDNGVIKSGYLKGTSDHPQANFYNSIFLCPKSNDLLGGEAIPMDAIDDIELD